MNKFIKCFYLLNNIGLSFYLLGLTFIVAVNDLPFYYTLTFGVVTTSLIFSTFLTYSVMKRGEYFKDEY